MLIGDFKSKLKKLNPNLWIDENNSQCPYHKDFTIAGLYNGTKFVMGVNQREIYPYSILAVNAYQLELEGFKKGEFTGTSGQWIDNDFVDKARSVSKDAVDERLLSRGYDQILKSLILRGLVNKEKAERLFGISINLKDPYFKRRYIDLYFTKEKQ